MREAAGGGSGNNSVFEVRILESSELRINTYPKKLSLRLLHGSAIATIVAGGGWWLVGE